MEKFSPTLTTGEGEVVPKSLENGQKTREGDHVVKPARKLRPEKVSTREVFPSRKKRPPRCGNHSRMGFRCEISVNIKSPRQVLEHLRRRETKSVVIL